MTEKRFSQVDLPPFAQIDFSDEKKTSKEFLKDLLSMTGMQISVTKLQKGTVLPIFHSHKQNEELYIVVEGAGQMQLDDQLIEVKEGSFVSIQPECNRGIRADANHDLVYLCIQTKANSLEQCNREDGVRHDGSWNDAN